MSSEIYTHVYVPGFQEAIPPTRNTEFINQLIANSAETLTLRRYANGISLDNRRDIWEECGFPKMDEISISDYQDRYRRDAITKRVIRLWGDEAWLIEPDLYELSDTDTETDFELALNEITLSPANSIDQSYYKPQEDTHHSLWSVVQEAEALAGIGTYGIVVLFFNDDKPLSEGVEPNSNLKLINARAFCQVHFSVNKTDANGVPEIFSVDLSESDNYETSEGNQVSTTGTKIHASRVVMVADNGRKHDPRAEIVLNHLLSLDKIYGPSAEMFFKGGFPGLFLGTDPKLGIEGLQIDISNIQAQVEQYQNGLQRYMALKGMLPTVLSPEIEDPTPFIERHLEAICIEKRCPKRIFMGTERGELASSQDSVAANNRTRSHQYRITTPFYIAPLLNRLIALKILPTPNKGYSVDWEDLNSLSNEQKAVIAERRAKVLSSYVNDDLSSVIDLPDFLSEIMGLDSETVSSFVDNLRSSLNGDTLND